MKTTLMLMIASASAMSIPAAGAAEEVLLEGF